ncbi:C1 family peptidase [Streptomyces sp. NPDC101150]|uniref:C1 family peptidase n=1 Tax=Streptomyces sp. NPDC101150 TaxID=3366114 RepID=UPI003829E725
MQSIRRLVTTITATALLALGAATPAQADSPVSLDWRAQGKVKVCGIQSQGQCGSCWAFATTCSMAAAFGIMTNCLPSILSEQQLIDCCSDGNQYCSSGCSGGWPTCIDRD